MKLDGDFGPLFGPLLDRTFHHPEVPVFEELFFVGVLEVVHALGGVSCLAGLIEC